MRPFRKQKKHVPKINLSYLFILEFKASSNKTHKVSCRGSKNQK